MKGKSSVTLTAVLCLLVAASLLAQGRPNFTGRWKANLAKSDFGTTATPREFVRTIYQEYLYLIIGVRTTEKRGVDEGELRFTFDGEESENMVGGVKVVGQAKLMGDHVLVTTHRTVDGKRLNIDELWTLSADGQNLLVNAVVGTESGEQEIRIVFEKQ